jgi:hypothetical protein
MRKLKPAVVVFAAALMVQSFLPAGQNVPDKRTDEQKVLEAYHSISSHALLGYVEELASDKYAGRLTGTPGFNAAAEWLVSFFKAWRIKPAGDNGTYLQAFPNPFTLVFEGNDAYLRIPMKGPGAKKAEEIKKFYRYEDEYIPGATSGSGEVTAEVIYVGYGITAPELSYDEYRGVDVKGKIVLMEREVPVSPEEKPDLFKKWRPYSFHQYKLENAVAHGAKGMVYNYGPITNPNNSYREGFIYTHVGSAVVEDIFAGTGRSHKDTADKIKKTLKPQSFATGKIFTLKNVTEHHPEGIGFNIIGLVEGSDPVLKNEVIIVGAHLDGVGSCPEIMPGANDNCSAVAVMMGVAEALAKSEVKPKRSVMFIAFGAEEQGVAGSEYYVEHPVRPLEQTAILINMEGPGRGDKISVLAGKEFPGFYAFLEKANGTYIHREMSARSFANIARPRQDTARFLWKGVPGVTVGAYGIPEPYEIYHNTRDDASLITPEIMEDIARLLFMAIVDMSDEAKLEFRN